MELPDGFTCQDCFAFSRFCKPLGIAKHENKTCDYYPVRFQESLECLAKLKANQKEQTTPCQ
jgi:hypothetical protein